MKQRACLAVAWAADEVEPDHGFFLRRRSFLRFTGRYGPYSAIHRFAISLEPAPDIPAAAAQDGDDLAERLARIERKLDAILARLDTGDRFRF